ncbi:putative retrotransposon hot spot protein 4 (RHS4) [Trypanosoma vivax]|nr:putative retrotransposon hot spot protein 4 (RHS4) [Trypanosoma vivax]
MAVPRDFYCALFVRHEVVRVWYLVKKCLDAVHGGAAGETTRPFTLIGSPGIGKSFGAGAFLLYMLLHYNPSCLHIVAWFIGDFVYVFLNEQPGKVLKFYDRMHAEMYIEGQVAAGLRVYVIYDVGGKQIGPATSWRPGWTGILITSPNESNYRVWAKEHMARVLFI